MSAFQAAKNLRKVFLRSDLAISSVCSRRVASLSQYVCTNRATNAAANQTGNNVPKNLPIYVHVLIGLIAGAITDPLGAWIYFAFIEKFLAKQSLLRGSKTWSDTPASIAGGDQQESCVYRFYNPLHSRCF